MKAAPVIAEVRRRPAFEHVLVHTGQHYDDEMSRVFLEELGIGEPEHLLEVGSGSHAQQIGRVMERLEPVLRSVAPDAVLVPGDVNSTVAAALTATHLGLRVGHIEAGLRSFDRTMPEEVNRVLTDQVADWLFIHSPEARDNLLREGRPESAIHDVGNTMVDTLVLMRPHFERLAAAQEHGLEPGRYLVVTLHRPSLVDGPLLEPAMAQLARLAEEMPVVFPVHPRTQARMAAAGVATGDVQLLEPLGYLEFLSLVAGARAVLTDSGGIQEETTFLGLPCFTLRDNTERPITCDRGTNTLLGLAPERIAEIPGLLASSRPDPDVPPRWDGHAAARLVDVLEESLAA